MEVVCCKLLADPSLADRTPFSEKEICDLLQLCPNSTYFVFSLYMEQFETKAVGSFTGQGAHIWYRYVDGNFVVFKE